MNAFFIAVSTLNHDQIYVYHVWAHYFHSRIWKFTFRTFPRAKNKTKFFSVIIFLIIYYCIKRELNFLILSTWSARIVFGLNKILGDYSSMSMITITFFIRLLITFTLAGFNFLRTVTFLLIILVPLIKILSFISEIRNRLQAISTIFCYSVVKTITFKTFDTLFMTINKVKWTIIPLHWLLRLWMNELLLSLNELRSWLNNLQS